jgi:hypothetical protein
LKITFPPLGVNCTLQKHDDVTLGKTQFILVLGFAAKLRNDKVALFFHWTTL